jgi:transposase
MSDTIEKWKKRVADWRASGQTAEAFSTGRPWSASSLRWWSSRLRRETGPTTAPTVIRVAQVIQASTPAMERRGGTIVIEALDARVRITIDGDAPPETISAVLGIALPLERR